MAQLIKLSPVKRDGNTFSASYGYNVGRMSDLKTVNTNNTFFNYKEHKGNVQWEVDEQLSTIQDDIENCDTSIRISLYVYFKNELAINFTQLLEVDRMLYVFPYHKTVTKSVIIYIDPILNQEVVLIVGGNMETIIDTANDTGIDAKKVVYKETITKNLASPNTTVVHMIGTNYGGTVVGVLVWDGNDQVDVSYDTAGTDAVTILLGAGTISSPRIEILYKK